MPTTDKRPTKRIEVLDLEMAYVEAGDPDGAPIVFLHGNPTSSYLWRDVMTPLEGTGHRLLAPDLVGMGESDKRAGVGDERYRFVEHRRYLDAWFDAVGVDDDVTLVIHDWGSALGFDWANRHRDRVRGIAFTEAICGPVRFDQWPDSAQRVFGGFRSEAGEGMVLDKNVFVEKVLPASIMRDLSDEELAVYRAPFTDPGEERRPTLTWPREIPFDGEPADVADIVAAYNAWLRESDVPKLYLHAEPGFLCQVYADEVRGWPNVTERPIAGIHFVQEDSGAEMGAHVRDWLDGIG